MPGDPEACTARVQIRFTGRVQGVGFRATTRAVARRYAVTGWVRNESDGSVTAEIQGERAEIDRCLAELEGHMARNIDSAHRRDASPVPDESGFSIRSA